MDENYTNTMRFYQKGFNNRTIVFLFLVLMFQLSAFSQDNTIDSIERQFNRYQSKAFQEKIYLHIDKTFYLAGETVWFKLYNVDAYLNKPLDLEKLAYVEIISKDQKAILQAKVELKDGVGNGSFLLPFSINSGTFLVRAYTSWMKNNSADYYFEQPITIVNFQKKPRWQELETPSQYHVNFYPEGGDLINGLQSKVAFKITDQYGKGLNCNGILLDQKKDTVITFKSLLFGMGHFMLTPIKGTEYTAIITLENNQTVTQQLPVANNEGYVVQLKDVDSNYISVEVSAIN
ncbi:MAG: hypothetical protein ABJA71_02875, partial [Ginsengibacter sp.]